MSSEWLLLWQFVKLVAIGCVIGFGIIAILIATIGLDRP